MIIIERVNLSSKDESAQKGRNRYNKDARRCFDVFRGTARYKRGGGGMFGMLAKSTRSILPRVGKKIFKAVAPVLLDEGRQLLTRKKNVKQAVNL